MELETQIKVCAFSISFGLYISLLFNLLHKYLKNKKTFLKFIIELFIVIINVTLYFLILCSINNGITNMYLLINFIVGFLLGNRKTKKIRNSY